MSKFIGRQVNVGLGKETVRGTAVSPNYWIQKMDIQFDDSIDTLVNDSSVGRIEDAVGIDTVARYSKGSIEGRIDDTALGLALLATLGTETSQNAHSGETIVYDHIFNVNNSAQHQSLTVAVKEGNADLKFALGMVETFDINTEIGKYCTFKLGLRANKNASASNTASYTTTEHFFLPQHANIYLAASLAGLDAASAVQIKKFSLGIKKNIEDDQVIGSLDAADRLNKQFEVEGTFEAFYNDRTYIDTDMLASLVQALRIKLLDTDHTIGSAANPALVIDLAAVKITEVARNMKSNDIVSQSIKFKAYYSLSDAKLLTATLTNLKSGAY